MKIRAIRRRTVRALIGRNVIARAFEDDLRLWDEAAPIGREFGSPDFDRLMEEDHHNRVGVFDPALAEKFQSRTLARPVRSRPE